MFGRKPLAGANARQGALDGSTKVGTTWASACSDTGQLQRAPTKVKYTEANGAEPSVKKIGSDNGQAGAIDFHITGTGDLVVVPVDGGASATCPVPPPPK